MSLRLAGIIKNGTIDEFSAELRGCPTGLVYTLYTEGRVDLMEWLFHNKPECITDEQFNRRPRKNTAQMDELFENIKKIKTIHFRSLSGRTVTADVEPF